MWNILPEHYVRKSFRSTFLICSQQDKGSMIVLSWWDHLNVPQRNTQKILVWCKWRVQIIQQTVFKLLWSVCFLMPGCIQCHCCYRANWTLYIPDQGPIGAARFPVQMDYSGQVCHQVQQGRQSPQTGKQYLPASYLIVELVSAGKPAAFPAFQMEMRL